LVQVYSGLIYRGPKLISECAAALKQWISLGGNTPFKAEMVFHIVQFE
jgi:dihydroorotate dehydrogenase